MMGRRSGPRVDIKRNTEISEGSFDEFVISIDDLLGGDPFFPCPDGNGHTVFVTTADKENFFAFETQIAGINVRRNIHSGEVSNMHGTVRIRECSSN
jgi:hypothetical protein